MSFLNRNFLIIVLLAVSAFIATDLYMPSFPSMTQQYHTNSNMIELSLTLFLVGLVLSQLIFGILSDCYGRKPMIIIGIIIYIVGSTVMIIEPSLALLLAGRTLQGLGIGAAAVLSRSITRDLYSGAKLAQFFSFLAIAIILAPTLAPVLGGVIQQHAGYLGNLTFMLGYGIVLFTIVYYFLPETNKNKNPDATKTSYLKTTFRQVLSHKQFIASCTTNGLSFSLIIVYSTVNPFILQTDFDYNAQQYGFITLIIASGMILGMLLNIILVRCISGKAIIGVGQSIMLIATVSLLVISMDIHHSILPLVIGLFCMNIGVAFTLPNMATKIFSFFDGTAGFIGAIYGSLRMLISAIIGVFVVALHIEHIQSLALLLVLLSIMSIVSSLLSHSICTRTTSITGCSIIKAT